MDHSRSKRRSRLINNRKGYAGIIATIFLVLVVLFLFFNVYTFMNGRNTAYQDTVGQVAQMEVDRNTEQVTISNVAYANVTDGVNVNCTISNTGPLPVQIVRLWLQDSTLKEYGSASISPIIALQPGNSTPPTIFFVNMANALANDSFSLWFVTARGNMITAQSSSSSGNTIIQVTNNTTAQSLSQVLGDFLPDYKSVQWAKVDHASGAIIGPWNSGWILPEPISPQPSNTWTVWKVDVTYYGNTTITLDPHTCMSFVPLSATAREEDEPFLAYIVNYTGTRIGNFSLAGIQITPSPAGTKLTLYLGAEDENNVGVEPMLSNVYYGDSRNALCIGMEDESEFTMGAYMNLVIYGKSPSTYAQTLPLFMIMTRSYTISLSPISGNVGSTVTVTGVGFDDNSKMTLAYDGVTLATSPTSFTSNSNGGFTATFTVPASTTGPHIVSATDADYNVAIATFTVTPNIVITPTHGPKGTSVTVSGTGFAATSNINVTFNGIAMSTVPATITTYINGSFPNATFTVPPSATGNQTVKATDANGNYDTEIFTVTVPSISLNPNSGPVGTVVSVSGQNFVPSSTVTITYDGITVATITANGAGSIPTGVTFTVPASVAGSHSVNGTDASFNSASAPFTVTSSIALSPSSGPAGSTVTVSGSGFSAFSTVSMTYAGSAISTSPSPVTTDGSGSFSATFTVPAGSATGSIAGAKAVTAADASSNSASATFTVTPAITLSPTSGNVGSTVTVSGTGYGATKTITIKYDGATQTTSPATVTTTAYGAFSCTFTVPASTTGGHTVSAADSSSNTATAPFTVILTITLSPTSGNVGSTVTVSGTGFAGSKTITATFNGVSVTLGGTTSTGSTGSFTGATFTVPASTAGAKTVVVTDASSNSASATFTVTSAVTLSPTSGNIGSSVTVSGTGFAPSSTVTIIYDGTAQVTSPATITTSTSGSFSAAFTAPASVIGTHTIGASDGVNSAFATFTVTQSISLSPSSGPVGSTVSVSGSGYAASKTVTIKFGSTTMTTVPSTVTTDAYGSFSCTFTVPAATSGGKTVTATDANSNAATATFSVNPAITLSPTSGDVGITVTVSGTGFTGSSTLTAKFNGATVSLGGTTSTGSTGSFAGATFTVPASAVGVQTVIITDGSSKSASATFTVTSAITMAPTTGPVGTTVTVSGSGFAASSTITIKYDGAAQITSPTAVTASTTGSFSAAFTVPASAVGAHTVTATDASSNTDSAAFIVTSAIALNPTSGSVGSTVTVSGSGFAASSTITVRYDGAAQATSPTTVTTDAYGSFSATFAVPASVYGSHTVQATDGTNSPTAAFSVTPSIVLNPTSGNVGSKVTISGAGFRSGRTITATFGGSSVTLSGTTTTDATGSFSAATFTVPAQTSGSKTVTVSDGSYTGSASFTVIPAITLSPTSGNVGSTVTVSGTGFGGSKTITATFGGVLVTLGGTTSTGSTGSFAGATFTVPASAGGANTVTITDASSNSASATFIVPTSSITITSSPVGSGFINVDGNAITTPATFTWAIGSAHTLQALSPVAGPVGTQYVWTGWSDSGAQTHNYTVPSSSATVTANYKIQYQLTMNTNFGTVSPATGGWYDAGSTVTISATAPTAGAGERYVWVGWTGSGTGSYTGTNNPATSAVTMNGPVTEIATWTHQYQLTMATNFGTTTPAVGANWYTAGSTVTISATPPSAGAGEQYVWNGWAGSGSGSYTGTDNPATNAVTMNGPVTETASWTHQYQVTFAVNPTGTGTTNPSGTNWFNAGATGVSISASANSGYAFLSWSSSTGSTTFANANSASTTVTISGADTITANFAPAISVTITSSQTGSAFVTVDGTPITTPQTFNWAVGSTHNLQAYSPVSGGASVQYVYTNWSDGGAQSHTYTVPSSSTTVTANYKTQYQVTFGQSGLDSSASGTVVTVNGSAVPYSGLPYNIWVDSGGSATYNYASTVSSSTPGKQFVSTSVTGPTSPITVTSAITITGNYKTQYQVTFAVSPLGSGTTIPTGTNIWYDAGYTINPLSATNNTGYKFSSWSSTTPSITFGNQSSSSTTATIGGNGTITANFAPRVNLSLDGSGTGYGTSSVSITLTTTKSPDLLYVSVVLSTDQSVSGVTDNLGTHLTWTKRTDLTFPNNNHVVTYWAVWSSSGSITITISFSSSTHAAGVAFGINGVNTADPWDGNARTATATSGTASVTGVSTSWANDFIIGTVGVHTDPSLTKDPAFTLIATGDSSGSREASAEYWMATSAQSGLSVSYTLGNSADWGMIVDAVKSAP